MGRVLHGSATTTDAIRRVIQHSQASLRALSKRSGINQKTVAKWRQWSSVAEQRTGPKDPRSTELSGAQNPDAPVRPDGVGKAHREQLGHLTAVHPWFVEQRVYGDLGLREDREFVWTVEPVERRESVIDSEGLERRVPAIISLALPDAGMRRLADQLIGSAPIIEDEGWIKVGESIVVTDGAFARFPGIVEKIDDRLNRSKIAVSISAQAIPVNLERQQFERAEAACQSPGSFIDETSNLLTVVAALLRCQKLCCIFKYQPLFDCSIIIDTICH